MRNLTCRDPDSVQQEDSKDSWEIAPSNITASPPSLTRSLGSEESLTKSVETSVLREPIRRTSQRVGRWTLDEKLLFLYGLRKFGKGRWKKISVFLPNRSLVQIKSHAQKVLKRMDEGENVYYRLDEHVTRVDVLVAQNQQDGSEAPKRAPKTECIEEGREHIIAASALCQLSAPIPSSAWESLVPFRTTSAEPPALPREVGHPESGSS